MNRTSTTIIVVFAFVFSSNAFALKQLVHVSPNATTFRIESQGNGMVRFTLIREVSALGTLGNTSHIPVLKRLIENKNIDPFLRQMAKNADRRDPSRVASLPGERCMNCL